MAEKKKALAPSSHLIRPVLPDDAPSLRALYAHSLAHNSRGFIQDLSFHGDIAAKTQLYRAEHGEILGLFLEGGLQGFGALKPKGNGRVELCHLHLHPAQQGQGLGKQLVTALIEKAKILGYHTVELHVTETQKAAIGLYRKMGFVQTDRHLYHHTNGQSFDTIFMAIQVIADDE